MPAPKFKQLKPSYGFDEVAIVPGDVTINPEQVSIELKIGSVTLAIPIIAAAMDGVVDVNLAVLMSKLGGLAVLHLGGVQVKYENPAEVLDEIAHAPNDKVTALLQKVYAEPIKPNLIGDRIRAVKKAGAICAASTTCNPWLQEMQRESTTATRPGGKLAAAVLAELKVPLCLLVMVMQATSWPASTSCR